MATRSYVDIGAVKSHDIGAAQRAPDVVVYAASVVSAGSWVAVGAGTIIDAIKDTSASTYMKSGATTPDPITLQLPSLQTPIGAVVFTVTARVGS